jgi:hypothetical protein
VPVTVLARTGWKQALERATENEILSGALQIPLVAALGDAAGDALRTTNRCGTNQTYVTYRQEIASIFYTPAIVCWLIIWNAQLYFLFFYLYFSIFEEKWQVAPFFFLRNRPIAL